MNKTARILFFSSGLAPEYGGAAISEASLCQSLSGRVEVVLACRSDRWNRKFLREFNLNNPLEFKPRDFYQAWKNPKHTVRDWFKNIDVVHLNGHWRWEYFFIQQLCREFSIPYVLHPRGMMLEAGRKHQVKRVFNHLIGKRLAQGAYKIIALSHYETQQLNPYGVDRNKVSVIPNGVCGNPTSIEFSPDCLSDHFLYFGRLEHRKNLLFLLEAYEQYRQMGGNKKLRLKGPIEHGYEQLIHKKVEELKLGHHVSILAPTYGPDKWRHLGQALAVIYPCVDEPFGRVPFETLLAGGLPILPTDSGGAEYLQPVLPQAIYPNRNSQALAERLFWAEKLELSQRKEALEAARDWVEEALDWKIISKKFLNLYWEAISSCALSSLQETDDDFLASPPTTTPA